MNNAYDNITSYTRYHRAYKLSQKKMMRWSKFTPIELQIIIDAFENLESQNFIDDGSLFHDQLYMMLQQIRKLQKKQMDTILKKM